MSIAVAAHQHSLTVLFDTFAICRLDANAVVPSWATAGRFFSITRTSEELSIVCLQSLDPDGIKCERDFRCFQVAGPIPFTTVGVMASLVQPLGSWYQRIRHQHLRYGLPAGKGGGFETDN